MHQDLVCRSSPPWRSLLRPERTEMHWAFLIHGWTMVEPWLNPFAECKKCKKNLARLWPLQNRTWISMIFWRLGCTTISFERLAWNFQQGSSSSNVVWCCMTVGSMRCPRGSVGSSWIAMAPRPSRSDHLWSWSLPTWRMSEGLQQIRRPVGLLRTLWDLVTLDING